MLTGSSFPRSDTKLPIVSIVVPLFGLTSFIMVRILSGNPPKKELQWRL